MDPDLTDPGLDVQHTDLDSDAHCYDAPDAPNVLEDPGSAPLPETGQPDDAATGRVLYRSLLVPIGDGQSIWTETPDLDLFNIHNDWGSDGVLETAAFQLQINGRAHDAWASDLTHDGIADLVFIDSDGDGEPNVAVLRDDAGGWQHVDGSWVDPAPEPRPLTIRPTPQTGNPMVDIAHRYETTFTETAIAYWQHYLGDQVPYPVDGEGYAVSGYRGFITILEQYGHLLDQEQVDEIANVVGNYQGTLRMMI